MVKNSMTDKSIFVKYKLNLKSEIKHVTLLMRIKDIIKRNQKNVVEKIDNKMMLDQNKNLLIIPPYCSRKDQQTIIIIILKESVLSLNIKLKKG